MGINFGAFAKGFTDVIREDQKETRKDNRIIVSNTLDKYTDNFRTKKDSHEKEDKIIESAANFVLSHIDDPVLAVQIANQGKPGMDAFKKNLEIATETGMDINSLYSSVKKPSKELASLTSVNEIIRAYRPFKAPSIPMVGGQTGFLTANPNETIKNALKDVVGTEESNKAPAFLGQVKVKQIPELKSSITENLLAIGTRESNFLKANGGDASALTGDKKTTYEEFGKNRQKILNTYRSLEKVKATFDKPTNPYSKIPAIKVFESSVASSIANSDIYQSSLNEVTNTFKDNQFNKFIVGTHNAINNVGKVYTDTTMALVLKEKYMNLQNHADTFITKARVHNSELVQGVNPDKHYIIYDTNESLLKKGLMKKKVGNTIKEVPLLKGSVVKVELNNGAIAYVVYTGIGEKGYLTGDPDESITSTR